MTTLTDHDIDTRIGGLKGWKRTYIGPKMGIVKTYDTRTFMEGLAFVTQVAILSEKAAHHPDIILTYPKVTLQLTTHEAGGLTDRDFALAAAIDELAL